MRMVERVVCALHQASVKFVESGTPPPQGFDRISSCNVGTACSVCGPAVSYAGLERARREAKAKYPDPDLERLKATLKANVELYRENGWECQPPTRTASSPTRA